MQKKPKHIAVIRLSAMGDVAMTVPVIRALVEQNSDVKVTVVSRPFYKPFFKNIPNVTFFNVDLKKRHQGFAGLFRLYLDLKKLNIDAVADLHNVLRSKIVRTLFALSGKKVALTNKGRAEKKALTRTKNKIFIPLKPMVARHADTFEALAFPIDLTQVEFSKPAILPEAVLEITGSKVQKWIGIAPFAQYESKVYPIDLMQQVIDKLAANDTYKIFLFGDKKKEIVQLNQLQNQHNNVVVLAGKLKFEQELDVISNLDIMLAMDSGNAHIAAMYGVKTVTLWGATHPYAGFAPFNQPEENCIVSSREQYPLLPTSVYGKKEVAGYENAMRTINPETVVLKVESILQQ